MDALIRSPQLATVRTRLSDTRAARPPVPGAAAAHDAPQAEALAAAAARAAMRAEIDKELRAELALQAQKLYDSERERARTEGHAAGMAQARDDLRQQLAQAQEQLQAQAQSALSALSQAHQAALARLESSVGEVAFAAVCRLATHAAASQEFVLGLVERTCAQLHAEVQATARLHPRDVEILRGLLQGPGTPDLELRLQSLALKLVADDSLALGGCLIETAAGQYDGGLESQLRRLHAVLTGPAHPAGADEPVRPAKG